MYEYTSICIKQCALDVFLSRTARVDPSKRDQRDFFHFPSFFFFYSFIAFGKGKKKTTQSWSYTRKSVFPSFFFFVCIIEYHAQNYRHYTPCADIEASSIIRLITKIIFGIESVDEVEKKKSKNQFDNRIVNKKIKFSIKLILVYITFVVIH